MKLKKSLLLLLAAIALPAMGQDEARVKPDSIRLDLAQSLEIALSDNPTIRIAGMEIERQKFVKRETRGALMPAISGSGSYNYNIMLPVMFMPDGVFGPGTGGAMSMGFKNSFSGGFSLNLPLYIPTVYETLKLNDTQRAQAVEQARASKITLALSVKKSYYGILLAQSTLEVIKNNIDLAAEIVSNSQSSYNNEMTSEYELITAKVQLSNLNPTLIEAENSLHNSRLMFNMLLGLPLDTKVVMGETLMSFTTFIKKNAEHDIDLSKNTDLLQIELQQKTLDHQLKIQKATRIPTLSAIAQYQVVSQNNSLNLGTYDWRGSALAGLQLQVPIFNGLSKVSKERQIKNQQSQLQAQRDYLEQNLSVEAQTAISNISSANKQMEANLIAKEQAKKGYHIAKTRYETGLGTIVEVNQAQLQLLQADLSYAQSIFNRMSAQADYDKAVGADF